MAGLLIHQARRIACVMGRVYLASAAMASRKLRLRQAVPAVHRCRGPEDMPHGRPFAATIAFSCGFRHNGAGISEMRTIRSMPVSIRLGISAFTLLCAGANLASAGQHGAGQHCVVCTNPEKIYLCEAQNVPGLLAANGGQLACITELAKRAGHDSCSVTKRAGTQCDGLVPTVVLPPADAAGVDTAAPTDLPDTNDISPPNDSANAREGDIQTEVREETYTADDGVSDLQKPNADISDAQTERGERPPETVAEMAERALEQSKDTAGDAGTAAGDTAEEAGNAVVEITKQTGEQIGNAGKAVGNAAKKTWDCVTSLFSDC